MKTIDDLDYIKPPPLKNISIVINKTLLDQIDEDCSLTGQSRSEFIRNACLKHYRSQRQEVMQEVV